MRKNTKYILLLALLAVLHSACEKNIDIDIDEIETMIVLNGILTEGDHVNMYLSRTRHILDNMQITTLQNATVVIADEEGNTDTLTYGSDQLYRTNRMTIESGKEYTVSASATGYNAISATSLIPEPVPMVRLDTSSSVDEWGEQMFDFSVVFDDPAEVPNYYMLAVRSYYEIARIDFNYILDTLYVDPEKDTVVMGYRQDTTEYLDVRNENVWFESENLAIDNEDSYQNRIIFSDKLFDGKKYSITGRFYAWYLQQAKDSATIYISLHAIDEHYYKYIDSRTDHYYAKNDPFAVPVVVHNNIENGVGILGGMSVDTDSITIKLPSPVDNWENPIYYDDISGN
ncbi:MAG: DUF4249 domain-containing protein [Bacteroidales bacterium]|nr:DUF4249 domain-containing protein [Bacteroidales bacterium]MDT8429955.1 DUF4249 domain-containing protein [Bacteroidales bacterium]